MASRRDQITMTEDELDVFVRAEKTLIIVSNGPDGFPHPMPMFFYTDETGRFLVSTYGKSQKVKNFERDERAALLIEAGEEYQELRSVMMLATTEILDDPEFVVETMLAIQRQRNPGKTEFADREVAGIRQAGRKRVILRFTPVKTLSWDHRKLGGIY